MPPVNDNFANRLTIGPAPDTITGETTFDATQEMDEVFEWGFGDSDQSVWYEFTPSASTIYRIIVDNIVENSTTDNTRVGIALYEGSTLAGLTLSAKTSSDVNPTELTLSYPLVSATSYKFKVYSPDISGSPNELTMDFDVSIEQYGGGSPPANDDLTDWEDLGTDPTGPFTGTTIDATAQAFEIAETYTQPSVWYKFHNNITSSQTIVLTKTGSDPAWKPYFEVYKLIDPTPEDFNDLIYQSPTSDDNQDAYYSATFTLDEDTPHVIGVYNYDWDFTWDDFELEWEQPVEPPENDDYIDRIFFDEQYSLSIAGTTVGATDQDADGEPNTNPGNFDPPYPSVWYQFFAPNYGTSTKNIQLDTEGSAAETYLEVFTGGSLGALTLIQSDHDSGAGGKSLVTLTGVNGGAAYRVRVSSPPGQEDTFVLNFNVDGGTPPANDEFEDAIEMTGFSDSVSGTVVGASGEFEIEEEYNTVWYKWTCPQSGRLKVMLDISNVPFEFEQGHFTAWRGTDINDLTEVEFLSVDNGDFDNTFFFVENGAQYYFMIDGSGGMEFTFDLSIELPTDSPAANDDPANAIVITPTSSIINLDASNIGGRPDSVGPQTADYFENANGRNTIWYKIVAEVSGTVEFALNDFTNAYDYAVNDTRIYFYEGDTIETATERYASIGKTQSKIVNLYAGETYWIAISSVSWVTSTDIDYFFLQQNEDEFNPDPSSGSTSDFDSVTGTFVADAEDGEFVASGGVGYGTIEQFPDGHYPYGYWVRFEVWSSSGDYLYRYGQSQQHIEFFRATKPNAQFCSLYLLAHSNGTQTIGYRRVGGGVVDTGYHAWGVNNQGTSGKMRFEVGTNGITIDGINFEIVAFNDIDVDITADDQFSTFDFGILSYPTDGTSYVDLDPEWDLRFSDIRIHDNPVIGTMGPADEFNQEISLLCGFTAGDLLNSTSFPGIRVINASNSPEVIESIGEYDGYSLDCSVSATGGSNNLACGVQFIHDWSDNGDVDYPLVSPPGDSYHPGMSFRFNVTDFPTNIVCIAQMSNNQTPGSSFWNATGIFVGPDGTLYVSPDKYTPPIPFCTTEEGRYNYIEFMFISADQMRPKVMVWLDNVFMGEFESTVSELILRNTNPYQYPLQYVYFKTGRLGKSLVSTNGEAADVTIGLHVRDIALTRCRQHRKLGPTVIINRNLNSVGDHNIIDSAEITATDIAENGDFSSTDGAGQPEYWSGYDRHDNSIPGSAMYLGWLFQTFGDSLVSTTTDGSGPPGLEGATAMRIEAVTQDQTGYEFFSEAAYVFGNGAEEVYDYEYADTLMAHFWLKGEAGQVIQLNAVSGVGGWQALNDHVMTGDWEHVKLWVRPQVGYPTEHGISALTLSFPDSSPGDIFLVKDFKLYVNADGEIPNFWQSDDNGATVTRIDSDDTTSYEMINEFPPTIDDDHIYMSTENMEYHIRGEEDDGKTHLPPMFNDWYLEYGFEDAADPEKEVYGARILMRIKGFNSGPHILNETSDFDSFNLPGRLSFVMANENGSYRHGGIIFSSEGGDSDETYYAVNIPRPPDNFEWTLQKWTDTLVRLGFHNMVFENSVGIFNDYTGAAVVEGVMAEILMYDRRLSPPLCVRPIDLSRVRFRAYETNEID